MKKIYILLLLVFHGIYAVAQNCSPTIDPTFGTGGKAVGGTTNPNNGVPNSKNILVQPDNKIVHIAQISDSGYAYKFAVIRFNSNGSLDSSFGTNGKAITSVGAAESYSQSGIIQADGKIVVTGSAFNGTNWDFALVRYNSNGSLDSSFDADGKLMTRVGSRDDYSTGLVIQPDGKIVAVGSSGDSMNVQGFATVRYNSDGSIDSTFGQNGKVISRLGHFITYIGSVYFGTYYSEYANAVIVQADGKIVVAGQSYVFNGCYDYYGGAYCSPIFAMVRYNSNGSVDNTFGSNGKVTDSISLLYLGSAALQTDGKILVTGNGSPNGFITERYKSNGSLDSSFGSNGKAVTQVAGQANYSQPNSLLVLPDGKFLLAGYCNTNSGNDFEVVRCNSNGSLDNTFNNNGIAVFHIGQQGSYDQASGVALQGNNIIVAGNSNYYSSGNYNNSIVVVRLLDTIFVLTPIITPAGPVSICQGASVMLSSSETGSLQWYRNNVLINGANGTVYSATTSGSYTLWANNIHGCGVSTPVIVIVNTNPPKPVITWNSNPYHFSTPSGYAVYKWYFNNAVIAGASVNTYTPAQPGPYKVQVTDANQCSNISDPFNLVVLSTTDITLGDVKLRYYPNPANTVFYIDIPQTNGKKITAGLYDLNGRLLQKRSLNQTHNEIPVNRLATGIYQLIIYNGKEKAVRKIMVVN